MRLHRFYVSQPLGEEVVIEEVSIVKQWSKVFRYKKGDFVILFNGEGEDVTYSIEDITSNSSTVVKTGSSTSYIPKNKVTLYLSVIKKDNFELAVQKATELGVTRIVPIISTRSEKKGLNEERLNKITVEASEQCGRGDIPTISPITSLDKAIEDAIKQDVAFVLQMDGVNFSEIVSDIKLKNKRAIFIGPEGGWSSDEEKIFNEKGLQAISLGETVLRAETAAIVGSALVLQ